MIHFQIRSYSFVFIIALLTLTACAGPASAPNPVRLQLNWIHQAAFTGYYAAESQGFYAAHNLQVEIRELDR